MLSCFARGRSARSAELAFPQAQLLCLGTHAFVVVRRYRYPGVQVAHSGQAGRLRRRWKHVHACMHAHAIGAGERGTPAALRGAGWAPFAASRAEGG